MWIDKQTFIDNLNLPNMTMTLTKCQAIRLYCADQGQFNWIPLIARTFNGWSSSTGNFNSRWSVPASHWSPRGLQRQLQLLLQLLLLLLQLPPQLPLLDDQHSIYWMITLITNGTPTTTTTTTQWSAPTSHWSLTTTTTTITASILWSVSLPTSHWSQQWVANTAAGRRRCVRNFPHSCVSANLICSKVGNCVCMKRVGLSHKNIVNFSQISAITSNSKIFKYCQKLSSLVADGWVANNHICLQLLWLEPPACWHFLRAEIIWFAYNTRYIEGIFF